MKQVFQVKIQIGDIHSDLYFEDKESAESTVDILVKALTDKAKKKLKLEANVHEVYDKETGPKKLLSSLNLSIDDIKG